MPVARDDIAGTGKAQFFFKPKWSERGQNDTWAIWLAMLWAQNHPENLDDFMLGSVGFPAGGAHPAPWKQRHEDVRVEFMIHSLACIGKRRSVWVSTRGCRACLKV